MKSLKKYISEMKILFSACLCMAVLMSAYNGIYSRSITYSNAVNDNAVNDNAVNDNAVNDTDKTKNDITEENADIVWSKVGSCGDEVKMIQSKLKELGLYDGEIDGIFRNELSSGVIKFQRNRGLKADGICGASTLVALGIATPPAQLSYRIGMSGNIVVQLQTALTAFGFYSGKINGYFDTQTAEALRQYQMTNNLTPDGIADSIVLSKFGIIGGEKPASNGVHDSAITLLAQFVTAAVGDIGYPAQCAVCETAINRTLDSDYSSSLPAVIYSMASEKGLGRLSEITPSKRAYDAAENACRDSSISGGALCFYKSNEEIPYGKKSICEFNGIKFTK